MFENKTFESIKQSIIDKLTGTAATIEGSYTGDIIAGAALEIENCMPISTRLNPLCSRPPTAGNI